MKNKDYRMHYFSKKERKTVNRYQMTEIQLG